MGFTWEVRAQLCQKMGRLQHEGEVKRGQGLKREANTNAQRGSPKALHLGHERYMKALNPKP